MHESPGNSKRTMLVSEPRWHTSQTLACMGHQNRTWGQSPMPYWTLQQLSLIPYQSAPALRQGGQRWIEYVPPPEKLSIATAAAAMLNCSCLRAAACMPAACAVSTHSSCCATPSPASSGAGKRLSGEPASHQLAGPCRHLLLLLLFALTGSSPPSLGVRPSYTRD